MQSQSQSDQAVLAEYFSEMEFTDPREKEVFLSYLRGFSILFFDPGVNNIVEIGGGQSTAIFALMADRFGCKISVIEMNPEAIKNKVRSTELCAKIYKSVNFLSGVSLSNSDLVSYYECSLDSIGGVPLKKAIQAAGEFVETSMDGRKEPLVLDALNIPRLDISLLETAIVKNGRFPQSLLDIYRSNNDEFDFSPAHQQTNGLLGQVLSESETDAVFLDSGEFSSLPEWEIVSTMLRVGGYVILHDIFFPKSMKNWLVCAAITVSPNWRVIYIDRSTPQGLMVAKRQL